jgi:hypothetical protein
MVMTTAGSAIAQQAIKLTAEQAKKLQEIQKQEEQRKKLESQMHVTRSDWNDQVKRQPQKSENEKCKLDPEQMKSLADSVESSRGSAGLLYIPSVIQKSRESDKQCEQQKTSGFRKNEPTPNAIHAADK